MTNCGIHWLTSDELEEWDSFVARHPLGLVYHLSPWQRVLETAFEHIRGRFLVLRDGGGQIRAGLPVYTVSSWLLGNRTVSVPFATLGDPLVSTKEESCLLWPEIEDEARRHGCRRIEIRTRRVSMDCIPTQLAVSARYKHHYLPLDPPSDALFRSFDKTTIRQRVEQARRAGVIVEERRDEQGLRLLYAFLVATRRRRCLPPMPFAFFEAMYRSLGPDHLALYLAMHKGEAVGGLLVLKFKDLWTAEYSGTADSATRGSGQLLNWETIQLAKRSGAGCYSFGRTSLDNTGLLDHKRRWSTIEEDLLDFSNCSNSKSTERHEFLNAGIMSVGRNAVRLIEQFAPARVQTLLGNFIYRHHG